MEGRRGTKASNKTDRGNRMKLKSNIIAGTATLAFLTIAAGNIEAQVRAIVGFTGTALVQGSSTKNGTVIQYAAPAKQAFATKDILQNLALDENAAGKYKSTTFPSGAQLVAIISNTAENKGTFQVLDKNNNLLVDVSNILTISYGTYGNFIISGAQNGNTGLSTPSRTVSNVLTISYDDSGITGSVKFRFYLTGIITGTTTDTTPNGRTGVYTETQSGTMSTAAGEGDYQGQPFVFTGSLTLSGQATLRLP
jgi:hypothetical protein